MSDVLSVEVVVLIWPLAVVLPLCAVVVSVVEVLAPALPL